MGVGNGCMNKKEMVRIARKLIRRNGIAYFSKGIKTKGISISYDSYQRNLISVYGITRDGFCSFLFEVSKDKGKVHIVAVYEEIETQREPF